MVEDYIVLLLYISSPHFMTFALKCPRGLFSSIINSATNNRSPALFEERPVSAVQISLRRPHQEEVMS